MRMLTHVFLALALSLPLSTAGAPRQTIRLSSLQRDLFSKRPLCASALSRSLSRSLSLSLALLLSRALALALSVSLALLLSLALSRARSLSLTFSCGSRRAKNDAYFLP